MTVSAASPHDEELRARFAPVLERLRASAARREMAREHPFTEVSALRELGFGALRLPRALGGHGASLRQLFMMLTELAAADSSVAQALRQHFFRVEMLLVHKDTPDSRRWLERVAAGDLFGNGTTEPHGAKLGHIQTRIRADGTGGVPTGWPEDILHWQSLRTVGAPGRSG